MVISNHPTLEPMVTSLGIPFHHVPMSATLREEAERHEWELMGDDIDLIVLARYMQVLSPAFLARFPNRIINIHHSFLPAFVGADPYGAAYERGVKLIGATAHYVTEELDAGPIIEQDVMRVDHGHTVEDMRRIGRYVERAVLARAVDWHLQDRIIVYENKTVVFV
jgi:formyltetrahydrofolate deformylase